METRHRFYAAPARSAAGLPDSPSEAMPRDDARVTVLTIAGMVFMEGLSEPWWCAVRDMSHGGARLELDRCKPPRVSEGLQIEENNLCRGIAFPVLQQIVAGNVRFITHADER